MITIFSAGAQVECIIGQSFYLLLTIFLLSKTSKTCYLTNMVQVTKPIGKSVSCPDCGHSVEINRRTCPRCNVDMSPRAKKTGRIWAILGLLLIFSSIVVGGGAIWLVQQKRAIARIPKANNATVNKPVVNISANKIDLTKMRRDELFSLVPVSLLSRYRSALGDKLPDESRVISQDDDQYLVLVGSQGDEDSQEPAISVLRLEGGSLADVSRDVLPTEFLNGHLGAGVQQAKFIASSTDIQLLLPATDAKSQLIRECANCEHAYQIQDLPWCQTSYQLGPKNWRNDPYTVFYITAKALAQRALDYKERAYVDSSLDIYIAMGLEHQTGQLWTVKNLTASTPQELKAVNSVTYALSNGFKTLNITVTKEAGWWQATALADNVPAEAETEDATSPLD